MEIKNRANTDEEKAEVMQIILKVWQETFPFLRLGQMLTNLVDNPNQLALIEDKAIVKKLEQWEADCKELTDNKT